MHRGSLVISKELWKRAKIRAVEEGLELQELISRALEQYLAAKKKGQGSR